MSDVVESNQLVTTVSMDRCKPGYYDGLLFLRRSSYLTGAGVRYPDSCLRWLVAIIENCLLNEPTIGSSGDA